MSKIVSVERRTKPTPSWCWWANRTLPYESAWSLLHKFSSWNAVSKLDLLRIFGESGENAYSRKTVMTHKLTLVTHSWISLKKFGGLFRDLSACPPASAFADFYVHNCSGKYLQLACSENLRFCPLCIQNGYHSPVHQVRRFDSCPVHGCELLVRCPSCDNSIGFQVPLTQNSVPYGCDCGHRFYCPEETPSLGLTLRNVTIRRMSIALQRNGSPQSRSLARRVDPESSHLIDFISATNQT